MKKLEARNEVLYVRTTKSIKDFVSQLAFKRFGSKRKESAIVNEIMEELRDYEEISINNIGRAGKEL